MKEFKFMPAGEAYAREMKRCLELEKQFKMKCRYRRAFRRKMKPKAKRHA